LVRRLEFNLFGDEAWHQFNQRADVEVEIRIGQLTANLGHVSVKGQEIAGVEATGLSTSVVSVICADRKLFADPVLINPVFYEQNVPFGYRDHQTWL